MSRRLERLYERSFRTVPQPAEQQTGVGVVTILFGLVISSAFARLAQEIQAAQSDSLVNHQVAIFHLLVAITLTTTSFIGYYTSRNLPRLRVRFFNKSFIHFVLDVSMVLIYFLTVSYVEETQLDSNGFSASGLSEVELRASQDATPEAFLVLVSFALYLCWDLVSHWSSRDELDRLALGIRPKESPSYGARRWVTVGATVVAAVVWAATVKGGQMSDSAVIVFDIGLILILVLYRAAKTWVDASIEVRGPREARDDSWTPFSKPLHESDVKRVLPKVVAENLDFLDVNFFDVDADGNVTTKPYPVSEDSVSESLFLDQLVAAEAITLGREGSQVVARLSRFGLAASRLSFVAEQSGGVAAPESVR